MEYRAISLLDYAHATYATWVMKGFKDIETRKWKPKDFKNGVDKWDLVICCSSKSVSEHKGLALCIVELFHIEPMQKGHEVRACCDLYYLQSGAPAWAWYLRNLRLLSPRFPVKGSLNIFKVNVPANIEVIPVPSVYSTPHPIFEQIQQSII